MHYLNLFIKEENEKRFHSILTAPFGFKSCSRSRDLSQAAYIIEQSYRVFEFGFREKDQKLACL